ncbi:hypothetical protein N7466_001662 [Penicillium verhagenii]|uniref:uncharacterized protein n=1 Tax=Penicillium verhagenii TaxID=1562060 RepID=UPI002545A53A|nr:uncharacterized protein N7466_001662 [Penicillium verhagenii]KAJ5938528.1 hypothetical protein N7466_001662 [Penicillium verhagenii]
MDPSSLTCFELPLPPWLQQPSTILAPGGRKRKKGAAWSTEGQEKKTTRNKKGKKSNNDEGSALAHPVGEPLALTPNEAHQYRAAGLPLDQNLPGGRFPHEPVKEKKPKRRQTRRPNPDSTDSGVLEDNDLAGKDLFLQHLKTLNSLLHRFLMDGDYPRAGRALGLLLRENFKGSSIDVRHAGKWHFGAEILLLRRAKHQPGNSNEVASTPASFTIKGFAEAKAFYERLVLAHPYSKTAPHAVSAFHFYPAMFGLWIYVTQEESSLERKKVEDDRDSDEEMSEHEISDHEDLDYEDRVLHKKQIRISAIRARELEQAQQIARRIDTLLEAPPYSEYGDLLEMRGMVSLWIGDLLVFSLAPPSPSFQDGKQKSDSTHYSQNVHPVQRLAEEKKEQRRLQIDQAREFLQQAKLRGIRVACDLNKFDLIKDSHNDSEDYSRKKYADT